MFLYRIKQFVWNLFDKVNKEDTEYIEVYLTDKEQLLFNKLSASEQKHCIRVARHIESKYRSGDVEEKYIVDYSKVREMVRLALLHDIGKTQKKLSIIDKSVLVILDKITNSRLMKYIRYEKINVYYNHGSLGAKMLEGDGYDERFLFLIENHHKDIEGDEELIILKYYDSIS
jgi:putative nucleotidyltransferase with HDIG domain